ncbi:MAG: hypothetical protein JJU11_13920 [Candidatus Sumerlaeia bacterium]|nr:hypothetical protein [Candidatus Sumerlaeia bacterium]
MAKRTRPPSQTERRARRIRAAVFSCFGAFLLLALLSVAAYGFMLNRQVTPLFASTDDRPNGTMVFQLSRILVHLSDAVEAPAGGYLHREMRTFENLFATHGQLFLWEDIRNGVPEERWVVHLPIIRPTAVNLRRVERALIHSNVLEKEGDPPSLSGQTVGWYRVDHRGVLVGSTRDLPSLDYSPAVEPLPDAESVLLSEEGWIPTFLRGSIPPTSDLLDGCPHPHTLEIEWGGEFHRGEVLFVFRCEGEPRAEIHPYFFPFEGILNPPTAP